MIPALKSMEPPLEPVVLELIRGSKPFNGTLWLMIPVENKVVAENVKRLLFFKQPPSNQ